MLLGKWKQRFSEATGKAYTAEVRRFQRALGATSVLVATSTNIEAFISSISQYRTRKRIVSALHAFYGFLFETKRISQDPSEGVTFMHARPKDRGEQLRDAGLTSSEARMVTYEDWIMPTLQEGRARIRTAMRSIDIPPMLWRQLAEEFSRLLARAESPAAVRRALARRLLANARRTPGPSRTRRKSAS